VTERRAGAGDRRSRRTDKALRSAFIALARERGYERTSVEDIAERADVARATFYAHYAHKEDLLTAVFTDLVHEVMSELTFRSGPWDEARTAMVEKSYEHAAENRDLYLVCLSGAGEGRARDAYLDAVAHSVEENFGARLEARGALPRVPVAVMARTFAGAHVALLKAWLDGSFGYSAAEMASMEVKVLVSGLWWAQGLPAGETDHGSTGPRAVSAR